MSARPMNLNQSDPLDVPHVLRAAAQAFREDASELEAAWQDEGAANPWYRLAAILDRAASSADRALAKLGFVATNGPTNHATEPPNPGESKP